MNIKAKGRVKMYSRAIPMDKPTKIARNQRVSTVSLNEAKNAVFNADMPSIAKSVPSAM